MCHSTFDGKNLMQEDGCVFQLRGCRGGNTITYSNYSNPNPYPSGSREHDAYGHGFADGYGYGNSIGYSRGYTNAIRKHRDASDHDADTCVICAGHRDRSGDAAGDR